ncbi:hypothetical protein O181_025685 [Austropuccinia psidii MF-1]|uniref:Uncharacterized protein n=1 Tax=Austropuccinia psidii MF-1 TaxID=1389203 RepID=A0A9Q3CN40_9BASI|nr:hypothetical protein [Austropuccinia psidii MF-1]
MWKRACDIAAKYIYGAKEYNKQRYYKRHMEPRKNEVEVRLTEEFSRKHPLFPVSLVKPYFQTGEDQFPSRKKTTTPSDIVEVEDFPGPVKKIIKARKIRLNAKGKDSIWSDLKTRQQKKTNGWKRMPYQMVTFI